MIRKLLFAAAAVFVGKKWLDAKSGDKFGLRSTKGEHVPTDLLTDARPAPDQRAVEAFRPDPHSPPSAAEKEAMRPVTLPLRK